MEVDLKSPGSTEFYGSRRKVPSVTFYQPYAQPGDFPSYSVDILCGRETFRKFPLIFRATGRPSVNFH